MTVDEILRLRAGELALKLPDQAFARLSKYLELLDKWSQAKNLVGPGDQRSWAQTHVADALALLPHLVGPGRLIDVGSGAGLPGAVVALCREDIEVICVEPLAKRHAFLRAVIREVGATNLQPRCERDDEYRASPDFAPGDWAVARAVWSPLEWLERGARLVRPGGRVLALEGREQVALGEDVTRHPYHLGDRVRAVLVRQL